MEAYFAEAQCSETICITPEVQTFRAIISKHFYRGCLLFGRKQQKTENVLTACTQTENPVLHKLKLQKLTYRGQLGLHDLGQTAESPSTSIKWAEHPAGM